MPLQSSGIIVVDKTSVIAASGNPTVTTSANNKSNIQQYYEFYDVNDGSSNIISEPNNNNGTSNSNNTTSGNNNLLMRRHQRTISSSSSSSTHSPSSATIQQSQQLKHHQVVTTNLQNLAYNQQQQQQHQQHHQQQQQMNQQQHHGQQATPSTTQPQQLIVSEEYIEQSTGGVANSNSQTGGGSNGNSGNVMISPSNDVLNQQIIKIVTADGTTGNMIIDSMGNVTTTNGSGSGGTNGASKVLFNNLTVLSKQANLTGSGSVTTTTTGQLTQQQHHQQTINFVNAKGLPYITTTSKGQTTTVQKMTAYKGNNVALKQSAAGSQQQHHVLSTTGGGHTVIGQQAGQPQQQVVQKVTMPRNVQMVTRVQTLLAPQHSPQQQQQQQQQHIAPQQHSSNAGQMVMQQKYVHNIVATGSGGGKTNLIKKTSGQSMKLQQHKIISTQQQQGVKTFIQQQSIGGAGGSNSQQPHYQTINIHQSQHQGSGTVLPQTTLKHVKSQKIIKQYNNAITNSSGAVSVATLHQNHSANVSSSATSGTYTISNKVNNVSGAGVHQQHHISTKISKQPKYVMQNHIVIPSSSNASSQNQNHKVNNANNNSIMVNQQILNINSCNSSSGTIKFVNAHGTVIQQQQQQAPTIITTTTQKVRTNSGSSGGGGNHQYQSPQQVHITQQQFVTTDGGKSADGSNIYHISSTPTGGYIQSSGGQHNAQQGSPMHTDDIMMMTDEVSARILQSMAQKSFNNQQRFHQQPPATTKIIHQSGSMPPPTQMTVQKQQHHTSTSNLILSPKEYPIYGVQQQYQQQQQRLCNSAPNSRSQSLERKYHDTTISTKKAAVEYYKVKSDIVNNQSQQQQAATVAMTPRIPVGTTLTQHHHQQNHQLQQQQQTQQQHLQLSQQQSSGEQDDELIGEEIRPIPVNTSDLRLQLLQAVLQDHTYAVAMSTRFPVELLSTSPAVAVSTPQPLQQQSQPPQQSVGTTATAVSTTTTVAGQQKPASDTKVVHFTNGTSSISATNIVSQLSMVNVNAQNNQHSVGGPPTTTSYTIYGQQIARPQQDDDAHSAISNGSTRVANASGDIDPGEETETAPEAEAEDDSITRCICDLTHDDGYMICCDKCSAWQHVDCMGIDRQNIPDEYLCELCQPREVDHARARSLQLLKRKEQTQLLLNAAQQNASMTVGLIPNDAVNGSAGTVLQQQQAGHPGTAGTVPTQLTKKGKLIKRKELVKKTKKEKTTGVGSSATKRRENKKTAKRKSKSSTSDPVDKHAANLRQWIENYESAVTNHYSPELRARLIAISKQPSLLQSIISTENKVLKHCGNLENKATTVPHAGGKILISNFDIPPNSPICELRGKYMLTTQYKTQNASINMNSPPPSNYLQTLKLHKIPGAFIFFYQLPGDGEQNGPEICVDTRTYGNEARFVRRSCRPNAVIQHLFEKGTIHLYVVSLSNIMASTEITIKHEPHDLLALENKKQYNLPIQPTSTACACGLSKDCLFGVLPPMPPTTTSTKPVRSNSKVVLNGCVDKSATAASKKKAQNINRGRSTSSSGDSNAGLLSPNNNNTSFAPSLYNSTTSIASLMHDSGVYTSSSSPSVSIPSPPTAHISSPPVQPPMHPIQQQMLMTQPPVQHVTHVKLTPPSPQSQSPQQHQMLPQQLAQQQQQMLHLPTPPAPLPSHPIIDAGIPAPLIVQTSVIEPPPQPVVISGNVSVSEEPLAVPVPPVTAVSTQIVSQEVKLDVPVVVPQPIAEPVEAEVLPLVTQSPPTPPVPTQPAPVNNETEQVAIVPQPADVMTICNVQPIPQATVVVQPPPQPQPQPHSQPIVMAVMNPMSPDITQQIATSGGSPVKSPQKQNCGRKTPAKQPRTSVSEDSSNGAHQQQTPTTPTPPKQEEKREARKLTREERKMEAILRAFEKMEKNQQRKQELKQAKIDVAKRRHSHSPSPKRSNSTDGGSGANSSHQSTKKNSSSIRKKKRKAHKSYNVNSSSQRKRRKSRMNSNDSDGAATSEESTSMLSPPIQGLQNCIPPGGVPNPDIIANRQSQLMSQLMESEGCQSIVAEQDNAMQGNVSSDANVDTAAGLLLAFANPEKDVNTSQDSESMGLDSLKSPERPDISNESQTHSPPPTPTIVSSTCLLIEAAVAPLENLPESAGSSGEFKYPAKTKTKKVLMSNWLHQTGDFQPNPEAMNHHNIGSEIQEEMLPAPTLQQHQQPPPSAGLDSLVQAAMCDYGQAPVSSPSFMSPCPSSVVNCDEPQNLSIVAKKVEEFIHQSEGSTGANAIESSMPQITCPRNALTLPLQVSTCSNNSSVKKRWLRQAISEETDENSANTPSSASPQLPNGFTTPLKKRRLVISSDDPNAITPGTGDEYTSEDVSRLNSIESGESLKQYDCELKEELKNEMTDMDDDVDILRSPSPGQKMVAEDNLVKIEPEDITSGDDVRIDVEREESREGGGEKFEYKEEVKEEAGPVEPVPLKVEENVNCKAEHAVKEETEHHEHVEIVESVKSEDEFIAVVDEPAAEVPIIPSLELVKEEQKPKIEPVPEPERQPQSQPLQEIVPTVKPEETKLHPVKNSKTEDSSRKRSKSDEKFSSKQRKSSSSSTPPIAPKLNSSSTENENIPDELADIQERLHSFHKENIMILQSRNKKMKSPKHSSSSSSSTSKLPSHSSSSDSQKKKPSKKPKKDRKSPKIEDSTSSASSKSKSVKKSSSSSSSSTSEKDKSRHRTSSTSSSSSKKRQLSFEHIERSGVDNHKRSNSISSSKDKNECVSAKRRRESSRSEDSRKSSSKSSSHKSSTSLALLPFQESCKVVAPESSPSQPLAMPTSIAVPPPVSAPVPPSILMHASTKDVDKHLQHAVMAIPFNNFNHTNVGNAMPIAGYVVSNSNTTLPPATQGYDMQTLLKVPPVAVIGQTPVTAPGGPHLPYYNTIYGKLLDTPSTPTEPIAVPATTTPTTPAQNLMLSDYLETKTKSYSSLGGYGSHSTLFGGLNSVKAPAAAGEVPVAISTTNVGTSLPAAESISTRLATTPLKILTKTASHDPRLNPILTVPEPPPAPKRKLSINEYRKRKQQSTDSNIGSPEGDSTVSTPTTPAVKTGSQPSTGQSTNENSFDKAFEDCERRSSVSNMTSKIDDTPKVQFSPAPTLLEKQQESISERLKSLKSKQASSGISSLLDSTSSALHGTSNNLGLHKNEFITSTLNRTTNSDLDNCLESISSSSTSLASSRETTPEPRETHVLFNNTAAPNTMSSITKNIFSTSSSQTSVTTTTTVITTPTPAVSEISLSYSPILDTSADNFDSPIAESIELQKNAAVAAATADSLSSEHHQRKDASTEKETASAAAHGKRD